MTCLRAWRSEVPREIWRFSTAGSADGRCEWLANGPPRAPLHTWVKCGCTLSSKVTPRGREVVGLRRTCAGLSCLMLDVFPCGVPGCINCYAGDDLPVCFFSDTRSIRCAIHASSRHVTSTQVAVSRKASEAFFSSCREPPLARRRDGSRRASHGSDRLCRVLVLA